MSDPTGALGSHPATSARRPSVVICDDHRLMAEGLRRLVEPEYRVSGVVNSGAELLTILPRADADCLLLDLAMPDRNGLDLLPDIRRLRPELKIVIVTMFMHHRALADACLRAGAAGFVPKDAAPDELKGAIAEVLAGRCYRSPHVPKTSHRVGPGASLMGVEELTPRQIEIVWLLGQGKRPGEIAEVLRVSPCTVTGHLKIVRSKLGVSSEGELVRLAVLLSEAESPDAGALTVSVPAE